VVAAPAYTTAYAPAYTAAYAPAYTAAYAPAYTAAYAPAYTAAYAPAYTAAYAPAPRYLTSYAPLQRAVVQTSYMPVTAAPSCSSCATTSYAPVTTTAYAPTTVYQSAQLAPVVAAPACSTCAAYPAEAPCSSCSNCATDSGNVIYGTPGGDPSTPQPQLPLTPVPAETGYPLDSQPEADPAESAFGAPPLIGPANDNQASRVSVDVHTAVYRRPAASTAVSTTVAKPTAKLGVDTGAWSSTTGR
jgi:hypothetical protein